MERIVKIIEKTRMLKGYSHEYMALKLDISQAAYSKLENNATKLSVERLFKIAEILEVEVDFLLELKVSSNFTQTTRDNSVGYLQKIENFYQENKDQLNKIIYLYEERIKEKDLLIDLMNKTANNLKIK
jgi:transcriptional regulator with XRE-family HTH domain